MRVSVIVRTYNRAYVLGDAIRSILNQTFRDFELIVVDDGSTDDTSALLSQFRDSRIRYIRHSVNLGVSAAANTGIENASGEILANLDSDDLWSPEYLETLVGFLDRHSEVAAAFCRVRVERPAAAVAPSRAPLTSSRWHGRMTRLVRSSMIPSDPFDALLARHGTPAEVVFQQREFYLLLLETVPVKPSACLIRREAFEAVGGYDNDWRSGEDWELYLRLCRAHAFGFLDDVLVTMRVQDDSTLAREQEHDKMRLLGWIATERHQVAGDVAAMVALDRAAAAHLDILGHTYLHQGRWGAATMTYLRGFRVAPSAYFAFRALWSVVPPPVRSWLNRS